MIGILVINLVIYLKKIGSKFFKSLVMETFRLPLSFYELKIKFEKL